GGEFALDFEVPLVIGGLEEGAGKRCEIRGRKSRDGLRDGVEAAAGMELREQSLIGLRGGGEEASGNTRSQRAVSNSKRIEARRVESRRFGETAGQLVGEDSGARADDGFLAVGGPPGDANAGLPDDHLRVGIRVVLAGDDELAIRGDGGSGVGSAGKGGSQTREAVCAAAWVGVVLQAQ